jgi:transcriptional regulator with XRE-family HTH domain
MLSRRVASFIEATGITHKQLARLVGCDRSQLTSYLSTGKGLSAERALRLMSVLNSSRSQLEGKFGGKAVSSRIMNLQERGRPMKLDSSGSWVPGLSGQDPNGSDDVTGVRTARDLPNSTDYQQETIDFLRDQQNIHRSAIAEIQKYLDNVTKSMVNQGSTEAPRRIDDNERSRTAGPKPPQFSRR